ncbi:unnamed protein product [Hyaloperonospora brassicae]|uniref:Exonuclease 1 n=1 Tax=Hyaloperonospora brassicae TaxID=162125 RepID=A0AAV0T9K1_HYABA|nr:unnamed protein product [Hyaloperonospora brassicae]
MGVRGLLPALKSVTDQVHVSKYAGKTVGVDASGWLYKGAYSCPVDLVFGRPTDAYLNYAMQQLHQLRAHDITPILVFDGAPLPAKAQEHAARSRSRAEWRQKAEKLLEEQNKHPESSRALFTACARAVAVTNEMVRTLMTVLQNMDVRFYVAPYEADAQLAFLSKHKIVDLVISDDSDCVPYGVKTVLFKLGATGWGSELRRRSLIANEDLSFNGWTEEMFIQLCVLAGCDYCPSIHGIGIVTAYKLVSQCKTPAEVLKALQQKAERLVPDDFAEQFYSAILTYRHQLVFDPRDAKLKMLNPLDVSMDILPKVDTGLHFLGNVELRNDVVASIASGQIHPVTHESYAWKNTAAADLCEDEAIGSLKQRSTRSLTSSESSGIIASRRPQRITAFVAAGSTYAPSGSSQDEPIATTNKTKTSSVRYEKPRPSSQSSWTHLDSVLGSSDHIVNFRSPKVSENFTPLAALHNPLVSTHTPSMLMQHLKEFERRPARGRAKRVRNPTNRRRDGKGSGFEGEVLCRVDQGHILTNGNGHDVRHNIADATCRPAELTAAEEVAPQNAKRPKVFDRPPSAPVSHSSPASNCSSRKQLIRPTPFICDTRPSATLGDDVAFNWTLPPRHAQQPRSLSSATATSASNHAFATSAEEKWDRILGDDIDDGTNSSGSQIDD